ncbi:hypothetical protein ABIE56_002228 [Luteibacter sp. 621]|jgi:hypothetical protein|uniref:hypothetical protein n=1 Tax=Luteibacter sp. 621 TaxID=3373916 RepID=UPI003D1E091E
MRNTKLILAMLAGCTLVSGAAFAQDAASKTDPTPASTAGSAMHSSSDSMKKDGAASSAAGSENGSMKSTHKKHKKSTTAEPAKSSTAGGM